MLDPTRSYDLIGDVHGCAHTLEHLLDQMGYHKQGGTWRHPSRMAVFLGDIIDRGPRIREALHIVHSGIASPEVVDRVMRASLGRRYAMVGPLEAADMTGLATVQDICQHLLPELAGGAQMMELVAEKVARGETGARSGQGFYRWDNARLERIQSRRQHLLRYALKP